ncbi:hypothetical protein [Zooshikella sp. RANM57]|uniref:hypothetical protein n=1 Tax=Zooshikella sp. RANM57 TaxID=3425863 RepID=UPI003D6FF331
MSSFLLLLASLSIYVISVFYNVCHTDLSGSYNSTIHSYDPQIGYWKETLSMTVKKQAIHYRMFFESDGIEGIALFDGEGKIISHVNDTYTYNTTLNIVHEAKISSLHHSQPYTNMLFNAQHDKAGQFKIIYYDGEIFINDLSSRTSDYSIFLFSKNN